MSAELTTTINGGIADNSRIAIQTTAVQYRIQQTDKSCSINSHQGTSSQCLFTSTSRNKLSTASSSSSTSESSSSLEKDATSGGARGLAAVSLSPVATWAGASSCLRGTGTWTGVYLPREAGAGAKRGQVANAHQAKSLAPKFYHRSRTKLGCALRARHGSRAAWCKWATAALSLARHAKLAYILGCHIYGDMGKRSQFFTDSEINAQQKENLQHRPEVCASSKKQLV